MFGHAEAVIDRAVSSGCVNPCRASNVRGRNKRVSFHCFGTVAGLRHELGPVLKLVPIATLAHERFVHKPLGHDHMGERREHGDIRARLSGR